MIVLNKNMTLIEKAIAIAVFAHAGQRDKGGRPYIEHVLEVGMGLETDEAKCVGILHDVVEDTPLTLDDLRKEFPESIVAGVDGITKRKGERYIDYLERVKMNPLSLPAKIRDLNLNKRLERIPNPTEKDVKRVKKYEEALKFLLDQDYNAELLV
jgi:GTP diphosphokinase / guanosine-3',5'-bis(diphosphate) 3'-diphosphatase